MSPSIRASSTVLTAHNYSIAHQITMLTAIFVILTWNQNPVLILAGRIRQGHEDHYLLIGR
ncbi:hypothetical protein BDV34DRAFT_188026 [Aspergillus parasiticus]|uniref:Uncharacterized protein n=1 Tax=Aspergillus parasiticus TaxID=5067 RepID=A0A5N6DY32_ASPPA|nr:hypothetical protein BDV34DRAFT_188026 [Aspergillus parasiticus]